MVKMNSSKRGRKLAQTQNNLCFYCKSEMKTKGKRAATIEHIYSKLDIRRWLFGEHHPHPLVAACWKCNNSKSREEMIVINKLYGKVKEQKGILIGLLNRNISQIDHSIQKSSIFVG